MTGRCGSIPSRQASHSGATQSAEHRKLEFLLGDREKAVFHGLIKAKCQPRIDVALDVCAAAAAALSEKPIQLVTLPPLTVKTAYCTVSLIGFET
jgi:hypothetical protein